jgi:hypothetical protein
MEDLGGCHVADAETAGDIGQRTTLDRRVPERLAFAIREVFEDQTDEVSIGDGGFHVRRSAGVAAQRDQRLSQSLPPPQKIEAVVSGDRQQPGTSGAPVGSQVKRLERDQKDLLGSVGRIVRIAQDARAHP